MSEQAQRWVTATEGRVEVSSRRGGTHVKARFGELDYERVRLGQHAIVGFGGRLFTARVAALVDTDRSALLELSRRSEKLRPMMRQMQQVMFLKNISMLGAALFIARIGAGPLSMDARRG